VDSVEASGKSIEDAILQALVRLGRNRDEVDIAVLQEPSRGTRGMGAREARVRVFVKPSYAVRSPSATPLDPDDELAGEDVGGPEANGEAYGDAYAEAEVYDEYPEDYAEAVELTTGPLRELLAADASIEEFAVEALRLILGHMGVQAVGIDVSEPEGVDEGEGAEGEDADEDIPLILNIRSDNQDLLSLLIGRRGETLSALQLLVNLIVSKQTGHREHIIVDAEGYRVRREQNLRSMALRIANQVRRSGHPVVLEAMPPNERRIIHIALAESDDISTESTGEGDQRRVVVSLKRPVRA
jgi:spoIIIJ-associated protein